MSERHAFLDAVRAAPVADAPKLIYPDWLDENGESERAALIRYQCALGPSESNAFTPLDLGAAAKVGLDSAGLVGLVGDDISWTHVGGFERGFVPESHNPPPWGIDAACGVLADEPPTRNNLAEPRDRPLAPFVRRRRGCWGRSAR